MSSTLNSIRTKSFLMAPGPTEVPDFLRLKMAEKLIHHRTESFSQLFHKTQELLQYLYQTKQEVLILSSSGTGAMESAVVNTLSPEDKVLVIRGGKFGERWGSICESYGLKPKYIDSEWGKTVPTEKIVSILKEDSYKAVLIQYNETSTGVQYDIKGLSRFTRNCDTLLIVDAITGLGVSECPMDEWGIDVLVCGSQKALMLPPGLGLISLSEKAWKSSEQSRLPKYYFDLKKERKALKQRTTAWTPSISLISGLYTALLSIREEGLSQVIRRHSRIAEATRSAVLALNLELFADLHSNSLTAVKVPPNLSWNKFSNISSNTPSNVTQNIASNHENSEMEYHSIPEIMEKKYRITIADGQAPYKGKIFRLGHMGYTDSSDLVVLFQALEFTLQDLAYPFEWGASLKAVQKSLFESELSSSENSESSENPFEPRLSKSFSSSSISSISSI